MRLRRAAAVRALGLVARDPAVAREATARLDRWLSGDQAALEPNLHDLAVALAARGGDRARFEGSAPSSARRPTRPSGAAT